MKAGTGTESVLVGTGDRHLSLPTPRPLGEACLQLDAIYPITTTAQANIPITFQYYKEATAYSALS